MQWKVVGRVKGVAGRLYFKSSTHQSPSGLLGEVPPSMGIQVYKTMILKRAVVTKDGFPLRSFNPELEYSVIQNQGTTIKVAEK
jgi:hypothetical protein